jgi:protein phosphatase
MRLIAYAGTDHGRRRAQKQNQDAVLCYTMPANGTPIGLYAVADGMGGQNSGEVASQITIETIRQELWGFIDRSAGLIVHDDGEGVTARLTEHEPEPEQSNPSMVDALNEAIMRSNQRIREYGETNPESAGLGSTLTIAMVIGDLALIGNIGDSRTYLVRDGGISRLTQDHSLVSSLVRQGLISEEDVYSHPHRNLVYQALGTKPDISPDIFMQRLHSGDILLLCSDGLWEMVRDEEIRKVVVEEDPEHAVPRLVDLANANGGVDNISVVVVLVS